MIGEWTVSPLNGQLSGPQGVTRVQPKTMDVLLCLASHYPNVVERDTLLTEVWGERVQSDEPLTRCIGDLRRALGDDRSEPTYIVTIPKRGYRLLTQPADPTSQENNPASNKPPQPNTNWRLPQKITIISVLVVTTLLIGLGLVYWLKSGEFSQGQSALVSPRTYSIAVLPFENLSADPNKEYFSDGISEELIYVLSKFPTLSITSRSSAFSFKGQQIDIPTIAKQLNVNHVLEGSVRHSGDRLRITTQLIDAKSDTQIWSESYEGQIEDIFATQDKIARQVIEKLELTFNSNAQMSRPVDPKAYSLVLQAKFLARQGTKESLEQALAFYQEAITIDPDYAPVWAYMSNTYSNLAGQGYWEWEAGFLTATDAANRAVQINPNHPAGHQQLAFIAHRHRNDFTSAIKHLERAYQLDPHNTELLSAAASLYLQIGQLEKSINLLEHCVSRSPLDARLNFNLGVAYVYANNLPNAENSFSHVLQISPSYNGANYYLGEVKLLSGKPKEALDIWQQLDGYNRIKGQALAYYDLGLQQKSDTALEELKHIWGQRWPSVVADVHAYRGDIDLGFEWLEKDYEIYGSSGWGELKQQRLIDKLKSDPRWAEFLERASVSKDQLAELDFELEVGH